MIFPKLVICLFSLLVRCDEDNGWQPCSDLETEVDGMPKIPVSKYGNWDQQTKCRKSSKFLEAFSEPPEETHYKRTSKQDNILPHPKTHFRDSSIISGPKPKLKKISKQAIKDSPSCLTNSATSTDPCFGFPCFMQISDCQSDNGYLNYFGEGMLCKKEAESSLFNDQGRLWWNCSQTCITTEIKATMATALVPCCNSLQEYGLNYVNPKCFVAECNFCSIYVDNFVALEEIFSANVENVYWQQILDFMDDCKNHASSSTSQHNFDTSTISSSTKQSTVMSESDEKISEQSKSSTMDETKKDITR